MTITEIKTSLSLSTVLSHYGLVADSSHRLRCPWHDDKTPSLQLYPQTNSWTCFSSKCTAGSGDMIDFVMRYEGISKGEAIQQCITLIGQHGKSTTTSSTTAPSTQSSTDYNSIFNKLLATHTRASQRYVQDRKLDTKSLAIAYNSGKSWDKLKGCLLFALRDQEGTIVSLYGRSIYNNSSNKHYYTANRQGLYPRYPSATTRRLILTESIIDSASIIASGLTDTHTTTLALYGTNGWTSAHTSALQSVPELQEVILFFDGDAAGEAAISQHLDTLTGLRSDISISKVNTPAEQDPNSLWVAHDADYLKELLQSRSLIFSSSTAPSIEIPNEEKKEEGQLVTDNEELLLYHTAQLQIQILGGIKMTGLDRLRVTLKIEWQGTGTILPIRQSLDLYSPRQVNQLVQSLHEDMELSENYSKRLVSELTSALEGYRQQRLDLVQQAQEKEKYTLTTAERAAALDYLQSPELLNNTLRDITASGIIGEENNALIGYIVYLSRKRSSPLHVMYLGQSGSGKTYLQEMLAKLIPPEDQKSVTSLSDQSLYYQGKQLKGKILFIEDIDGAENVLYIIRELQTKGWVMKTVVWKDPRGNMQSIDITAEGPVCISSCTTHEKVYEDNANRCLLLYIDTSAEQDQRIMHYQKLRSAGKVKKHNQQRICQLHHNIQRLLQPIDVVNPYAELIDLPREVFRPRRSLQLLLGFIETLTFYHQYQREVHTDKDSGRRYILSTYEDVRISFDLLENVLFQKSDELTHACRTFLEKLKAQVPEGEVFTAKSIRQQWRLHPSKVKRYLLELQRFGYVKVVSGSRYKGYEYQISDYHEYHRLRSGIRERLDNILQNIESVVRSSSVVHASK